MGDVRFERSIRCILCACTFIYGSEVSFALSCSISKPAIRRVAPTLTKRECGEHSFSYWTLTNPFACGQDFGR